MIDQLYIALKRAAFDRQGFEIAGSTFSAGESKQLADSLALLMGDSVALQELKRLLVGGNDD